MPVHSLCFGMQGSQASTHHIEAQKQHIAAASAIAAMFSTGSKHASQRLFFTSSCAAEELAEMK